MRTRGFSVASGAASPCVRRPACTGPSVSARAAAPAMVAMFAALVIAGCGDNDPRYPNCGSDKDCARGGRREHCVNQQCRQCASDRHCKAGASCVDGGCVLPPGACSDESDCPNGQPCLQNRCTACQEDHQCGPSRRCRNGRCLVRGRCAQDDDCADEEDCVRGECKRAGRTTPPDVACQLPPVYFGFDQASLGEVARAALGQAAECVQSAPGRGLFLNGYTDPRGTEEYNIALSERRAQTVADYLARLGIDPARFRIVPRGETQATGTDQAGWTQDRRVEIEWQ